MSLSKRSKIVLFILLLVAIGGFYAYKVAYKPHKTLDERIIAFKGSVLDFSKEVATDAAKFQDVVVELTGKVTSKDANGFTLNGNTYCQLNELSELTSLKEEQTITVKARMIGYDDLLEELKLDQAKIIE